MAVAVLPITDDAIGRIAQFLETNTSSGLPAETWRRTFRLNRAFPRPNNGFMLVDDNRVVGSYIAYYSTRAIDGRTEAFCNLASWCVLPEYRFHGFRLLRALLDQDGYHFLDFSPSGTVIPLNERLGFTHLDERTVMIPTLPWPHRPGSVSSDPAVLQEVLTARDADLYRDHRDAAAAHHVVLREGNESCYVVFRLDRRKNLPRVFATILHIGDPELFRRQYRALGSHLLLRHRALVMLLELRLVRERPKASITLSTPRRKMMRSSTLRPEQIDYFYSELVSVPW